MSESDTRESDLLDGDASTMRNGNSSPATEAGAARPPAPDTDADFRALGNLVSLFLGAALEGSDALAHHLHQWTQTAGWAEAAVRAKTETRADALRYAVLGMAMEGQDRLRRRLTAIWRLSEDVAYVLSAPLRLATGFLSDPRQPRRSNRRLDRWRADLDDLMDHWIAVGRQAEVRGRLLAREAAGRGFDEILGFLAQNPEVRELIEQQGLGLADTAVEEARRRTATADTRIEQLVRAWFRRPPSSRPPEAPSSEGSQ